MEHATWRRSRRSGGSGNCVEVARGGGGVLIRDSKRPDGPRLEVSREQWRELLGKIRAGGACSTS
ncbi:DUF397 domain-containing protein [Bailinhaonella thermotolerans]|uniref:DUF397 domain-containing protein n=1 Tax=Bailinhaonella thermotolerans TaxID=1070861 RepID=A0A3A4AHT6_9ACTN|nr:DUF397 domain-containing protein [Bailinhaonella thermotolerans]RJL26534.1 DUF397 domain-containing protein [Bailinhaonella thermotolerans]